MTIFILYAIAYIALGYFVTIGYVTYAKVDNREHELHNGNWAPPFMVLIVWPIALIMFIVFMLCGGVDLISTKIANRIKK